MELIGLLIGLIVLIAVLGLLFLAATKAASLFPLGGAAAVVFEIVLLILLAVILLWLFGGYVQFPRHP